MTASTAADLLRMVTSDPATYTGSEASREKILRRSQELSAEAHRLRRLLLALDEQASIGAREG